MVHSQILVSAVLIVCGFLVKKYPNLIAGYNTMSQVDKKKVNINTLSVFLKQLLIGLGIFTLLLLSIALLKGVNLKMIVLINSVVIVFCLIAGAIYTNISKKFKN